MKRFYPAMIAVASIAFAATQIQAEPGVATQPLYQVTVVQTPAKAISYRGAKGASKIDFKGTVLLPSAKGVASVRSKGGVTEIEAKFENLMPATQFGPEYLTYVLWAISPEGRATNLGEVLVKDGKGQITGKTPLQAMGLLVTAEPYFAVSQPSNVVILDNVIKNATKQNITYVDAKYDLLPRGQYTKNMSATDNQPQKMDKNTPFVVYQARNAVRIAKAAGADKYASDGYVNAVRLLALADTKEGGKKGREQTAREAVQTAEDSRAMSVKRQAEEAAALDQKQGQDKLAAATAGMTKAEADKVKAEADRVKADTDRTAALAVAANATAATTGAQADANAARESAAKMKGEADSANSRAQQAESEKTVLRAQLLTQLNSVLQTKDTARGLIVNMSDALFQTGSAELKPAVREKLAKVAGIVASHPGLKLDVEGHTDNVGSEAYNQKLSENRAQAARDYLVSQGVASDAITAKGFGKTTPVASNDDASGRAKNRRVELVVSGDSIIGTSAAHQ